MSSAGPKITTCHVVTPSSVIEREANRLNYGDNGDRRLFFQSDTVFEKNLGAELIPTERNHRVGCDH